MAVDNSSNQNPEQQPPASQSKHRKSKLKKKKKRNSQKKSVKSSFCDSCDSVESSPTRYKNQLFWGGYKYKKARVKAPTSESEIDD